MRSYGSSRQHMPASILTLLLVLVCAGCVVIPTSRTKLFEEQEALIESLAGTPVNEVRAQLGKPDRVFELPEVTYIFYRRDGEEKWLFLAHPVVLAGLYLPVNWGAAKRTQCLLIESRNDTVVSAKVKSRSDSFDQAMNPEYVPAARMPDCPTFFWNKKERRRIEAAARRYRPIILIQRARQGNVEAAVDLALEFKHSQYLRQLAEDGDPEAAGLLADQFGETGPLYYLALQGNVEAAVELAKNYGDPSVLKALKQRGNEQAADEYLGIACKRVYYRTDSGTEPRISDAYVHLCDDDALFGEETELLEVSDSATDRAETRWYFKTTPSRLRDDIP